MRETSEQWYVLTVRPGMERAASHAVRRIGGMTFLPGERRWVRPTRRKRGPERKVQRTFVSYPGYLFAGFSSVFLGTRGWEEILELDLVSGVISQHRCLDPKGARLDWRKEPKPLPASWRLGGWLTDKEDVTELPDRFEPPPVEQFQEGDDVIVTDDVFDRFPTKFKELAGEHMRVLMPFFGSEYAVSVPAAMVMKA